MLTIIFDWLIAQQMLHVLREDVKVNVNLPKCRVKPKEKRYESSGEIDLTLGF